MRYKSDADSNGLIFALSELIKRTGLNQFVDMVLEFQLRKIMPRFLKFGVTKRTIYSCAISSVFRVNDKKLSLIRIKLKEV